MILDEAPMRALSPRFGLAVRLPPNTVQRGVDLAMGPTPGALTGRAVGTGLDVLAEGTSRFEFARWIAAKCPAERDRFIHAHPASVARDLDGAAVFLAASAFDLKYEQDKWPEIVFLDIKDKRAQSLAQMRVGVPWLSDASGMRQGFQREKRLIPTAREPDSWGIPNSRKSMQRVVDSRRGQHVGRRDYTPGFAYFTVAGGGGADG
jgi:hypothetical protein